MSYIEKVRWWTDKFIYVMLGVFPLYWGGGYTNITKPKALFLYIAVAAWLSGVLLLCVLSACRHERFRPQIRPVHWAVAAFMLLAAVSSLLSPWWQVTLFGASSTSGLPRYDGLITQLCFGVILFGVSFFAKPKRSYIWVMAGSAVLCCLVAVLQLLGFNPLGLFPDGTNYYDKFVAYNSSYLGTIGNSGLFGQYLCIVTPITIVCGLRAESPWEKIGLLSASLLFLLMLLLSRAEAAYVGAAACVLVCVPLMLQTKKQRRTAALCALGLVIAGLAAAWFWPGESGTLWELSRILHGDIRDEFGSHRVEIWRGALKLIPERPLLGGGPGTFGERIDIQWRRFIEETGKTRVAVVSNAHNAYIAYLVNNGILGLASYLAAIVCSAKAWLAGRLDNKLVGAIGCGVFCCLIQDFFCVTLPSIVPVMWILWALCIETEE